MKQTITKNSQGGAKMPYSAPATEMMDVRMEGNLLYSGNGSINNLNNQTYDWDDSDWVDA